MIPKTIHYCWFGRGQMPELAVKCIESWKKYLPEYEIKEWNEDNFDLNLYFYVREAYDNRRFAFVTDVVRLYALYNEGGVYMDTDVEVLKPLDKFLGHHAFSGFEDLTNIPTGIMGAEKGSRWAKENLDYYKDRHFIVNGKPDATTNVTTITNHLDKYGLKHNNTFQEFEDLITIYPKDVFCPKSYEDGEIHITSNTHTIHHFAGSWLDKTQQRTLELQKKMRWMPALIRSRVAVTIALWQVEGLKAVADQYCESIIKRVKKS